MSNLTSLGLFAATRAAQSAALKAAQQPRPTPSISALFPGLDAQLAKIELVKQAEKRAEMASANQFNSRPAPTFSQNPGRLGSGFFQAPKPAPRFTKGNVLEFIGGPKA